MESKPLSQRPVRWLLWLSVPLITVALYALTTVISGMSYNLAEQVASPLMRFDPDQAFLVISIHHVFQAIAAFLLIALLALVLRKKVPDFGFNKNELRFSIRSVLLFCGVWFVIQFALSYLLTRSGVVDASFAYPLTARNFVPRNYDPADGSRVPHVYEEGNHGKHRRHRVRNADLHARAHQLQSASVCHHAL